jgi:excisionase family DNA binding protein
MDLRHPVDLESASLTDRLQALLPPDAHDRGARIAAARRIDDQALEAPADGRPLRSGEEPLLTSQDVADVLAVPLSTVRRLTGEAELPTIRIGRKGRTYRYRAAAVERWIRDHEV